MPAVWHRHHRFNALPGSFCCFCTFRLNRWNGINTAAVPCTGAGSVCQDPVSVISEREVSTLDSAAEIFKHSAGFGADVDLNFVRAG